MSSIDADADGDSQMLSSESSDSDMFPSANEPTTPQNTIPDIHAQLRSSELSPPNSQDHVQLDLSLSHDRMELSYTQEGPSEVNQIVARAFSAKMEEKEGQKGPGWAWNNTKALEEFQRSYDQIIDKNFNLREFGELFDERDDPKKSAAP